MRKSYYIDLFIYHNPWISGPLLSITLFRQPNYWRSASYTTCFATNVDLHDLCYCIHNYTCLQCMLRQRLIPSWHQGNLQLRRKWTNNQHRKALRAKHTDHSATESVLGYRGGVTSWHFLFLIIQKIHRYCRILSSQFTILWYIWVFYLSHI